VEVVQTTIAIETSEGSHFSESLTQNV